VRLAGKIEVQRDEFIDFEQKTAKTG